MINSTKRIFFKQDEPETDGPSVNSEDIEQRILARRLRIEKRIEQEKSDEQVDKSSDEVEKPNIGIEQIGVSTKRLFQLTRDGDSFISNIRVACDARENLRRAEEEELNKIRIERLEKEAKESLETFNKITEQWETARTIDVPNETRDLLQAQKALCIDLVAEKNKLINELNLELKAKDDHYVRELKKRTEDVELLAERMESQVQVMRNAYREELEAIENAFLAQKDRTLSEQNAEWQSLMLEISQKQINYLKEHREQVDEFQKELDDLRTKQCEEYNKLKILLETEVETLESQLLKLKATYQLNLEKLEYNFQVLKRRDEENMITKSNQKRKITRMQDLMNNLHIKAVKQEKQYNFENEQLSEDYKRRMENFRDLQMKSKLFIESEHRIFRDIWIMNEESLKKLANRLLEASRVICEQQLGIPWHKPDTTFMCNIGPLNGTTNRMACKPPAVVAMELAFKVDPVFLGRRRAKEETHIIPTSLKDVSPEVVREFLQLLCYEPEFLIEEKLKRLLKPLNYEEEMMMRLDTILTALGVETEEDLDDLFTYFIQKNNAYSSHDCISDTSGPSNDDDSSNTQTPTFEVAEDHLGETLKTDFDSKIAVTTSDEALMLDAPNVRRSRMTARTLDIPDELTEAIRTSQTGAWNYQTEETQDPEAKPIVIHEITEDKNESKDKPQHPWSLVSPVNVISVLRQFSTDLRRRELLGGARCTGARIRPENKKDKSKSKTASGMSNVKREKISLSQNSKLADADKRDDSHDAEYWNKYAYGIVSEENERVWDNLYKALERYLQILQQRAKTIREAEAMRRQNVELRHLLEQYLKSKITCELQIPPTQTVEADQ